MISIGSSELADLLTGNRSSQQAPSVSPEVRTASAPIALCGTMPSDVAPAEYYVEELWSALDKTLDNCECGVGSDLLKSQGGTLGPVTFYVEGAPAPVIVQDEEPSSPSKPKPPPAPPLLPDMNNSIAIKSSIHAQSPRIVAVHGPTGTGKSTVHPLAVVHWTESTQEGFKSGLTICAQPRRILARQLCCESQLKGEGV